MSDENRNIANLQARVKNLEGWQKRQNGSIQNIEKRVNRMESRVTDKFDRLQYWIMGIAAGLAVQLLVLFLSVI